MIWKVIYGPFEMQNRICFINSSNVFGFIQF